MRKNEEISSLIPNRGITACLGLEVYARIESGVKANDISWRVVKWVCYFLQSTRDVVTAANSSSSGGIGKLQYVPVLISELTESLCFTVFINVLFDVVICHPMLVCLRARLDFYAE